MANLVNIMMMCESDDNHEFNPTWSALNENDTFNWIMGSNKKPYKSAHFPCAHVQLLKSLIKSKTSWQQTEGIFGQNTGLNRHDDFNFAAFTDKVESKLARRLFFLYEL